MISWRNWHNDWDNVLAVIPAKAGRGDSDSPETETIELKPTYVVQTSSESFTDEIANVFCGDTSRETKKRVASFVAETADEHIVKMSHTVKTFFDVQTDTERKEAIVEQIVKQTVMCFSEVPMDVEEIRVAAGKAVESCVETLTGTMIPIWVCYRFAKIYGSFSKVMGLCIDRWEELG